MPTVTITGGTGTIGKRLCTLLREQGFNIVILTRNLPTQKKATPGLSYAHWDVAAQTIDSAAISRADYIINLAGAGIADQRWTATRKKEIADSRTKGAALLVKALTDVPNNVQAVLSASAIGYYGPDNLLSQNDGFTEDDQPASDFLANTCRQWEQSIAPVKQLGIRLVILRTGIVMSRRGGAYAEFSKPLKAGMAAIMGNGKQIVSWIHEADICNMYLFALKQQQLSGVYNAVAPQPVSNRDLVRTIARSKHKFFIPFKVPAFLLRTALGEMSQEVLKSTTVSAGKIVKAGFNFLFPDIKTAAKDLAGG